MDIKDLNTKMKESNSSSNLNDNFAKLFCSIFPSLNDQKKENFETTAEKDAEQGQ